MPTSHKSPPPSAREITIDLVTAALSMLALVVSIFTLWVSVYRPCRLSVTAPAITQANDEYPSLILTMAFQNSGAQAALITDVSVRLLKQEVELPYHLRAQSFLPMSYRLGHTPLSETTEASLFAPLVVKGGDAQTVRLYLLPFVTNTKFVEADIRAVDSLALDLKLGDYWHRGIHTFHYDGFREKFVGNGVIHVPTNGFAPTFFREAGVAVIKQ